MGLFKVAVCSSPDDQARDNRMPIMTISIDWFSSEKVCARAHANMHKILQKTVAKDLHLILCQE